MAARIPEWWASVIALLAYVGISTSLLFWYFRRLGHGPVTAYCASTPGGLNEMVLVAQEMRGDYLSVALVHATRVLVTVLIVPFGFVALGLYDQGSRAPLGAAFGDIPLDEAAILTAGGIAGYFGAKALNIPAAALTGPDDRQRPAPSGGRQHHRAARPAGRRCAGCRRFHPRRPLRRRPDPAASCAWSSIRSGRPRS